jgi:hypothetical protein
MAVLTEMFQRLKRLFAPKPPPEFRHPEFGVMRFDCDLWSGEAQREGRSIPFVIAGTRTEPDSGLLERVRELVERFPEVERGALEFLRAQDESVAEGEFEFFALDLLWEDKPQDYTLEFTLAGDTDGIWVEYENGVPKSIGRDD